MAPEQQAKNTGLTHLISTLKPSSTCMDHLFHLWVDLRHFDVPDWISNLVSYSLVRLFNFHENEIDLSKTFSKLHPRNCDIQTVGNLSK